MRTGSTGAIARGGAQCTKEQFNAFRKRLKELEKYVAKGIYDAKYHDEVAVPFREIAICVVETDYLWVISWRSGLSLEDFQATKERAVDYILKLRSMATTN